MFQTEFVTEIKRKLGGNQTEIRFIWDRTRCEQITEIRINKQHFRNKQDINLMYIYYINQKFDLKRLNYGLKSDKVDKNQIKIRKYK